MAKDGDKSGFSADIPDAAIAEALAAVEKCTAGGPADGADGAPARPGADPATTPTPADGAQPSEADRLRLALDLSQERSRKVFEQLRDEHDRLLRTAADLENYKKRAVREKEEVLRYGNERLLKDILPVVDNLDRALAAAAEGDPLAAGIEMTRRALFDALGRHGVKAFSALGQAFDPRLHEALMTIATADHAPGTVLEEQQRGFMLHDRLLRAAAVVVAAPAPAADEGGASGDAA